MFRRRRLIPLLTGLALAWSSGRVETVAETRVGQCPIVILTTAHPLYREAASAIQSTPADGSRPYVVIELPRGAKPRSPKAPAERAAPSAPAPATQPAETGPATAGVPPEIQRLVDAKPALVIATGEDAVLIALQTLPDVPVLFTMVPDALDLDFMQPASPDRDRVAGVTTDIAPNEQVAWVSKLAPQVRRLGVLHGPHSALTAKSIRAAADRRFEVLLVAARKEEFAEAIKALEAQNADGVLMIADADVYNAASVRELLVWGLRKKKAVWTFAPNIAETGALAAQYSAPTDIGRQTAELVKRLLGGAKLKDIGLQYPSTVKTAVNERTAEMIGLRIDRSVLESLTVRYGGQR